MSRHARIADHLEVEQAKPKLPVIFRVWKDTGDAIAFFPTLPGTNDPGTCLSYMHVGQHSAAAYVDLLKATRSPLKGEVRELASEIARIYRDCRLVAYKRETRKHREARFAEMERMDKAATAHFTTN